MDKSPIKSTYNRPFLLKRNYLLQFVLFYIYWSIMDRQNDSKLNKLLAHWPMGHLLTANYLKKQGYYKQLVKLYCDRGWLTAVGRGVYSRLNDPVTWPGAVAALQTQLQLKLHVGGPSALKVFGIQHYVMLNQQEPVFYLYNSEAMPTRVPSWLTPLFPNARVRHKKLFNNTIAITTKTVNNIQLLVSEPERAILEVLSDVPQQLSLEHAIELMEGLDRLRPRVMQTVLEQCLSIKVKRLFLYCAEQCQLHCFQALNLDTINLGSGNRTLGDGGHYNRRWQLSLPRTHNMNDEYAPDDTNTE